MSEDTNSRDTLPEPVEEDDLPESQNDAPTESEADPPVPVADDEDDSPREEKDRTTPADEPDQRNRVAGETAEQIGDADADESSMSDTQDNDAVSPRSQADAGRDAEKDATETTTTGTTGTQSGSGKKSTETNAATEGSPTDSVHSDQVDTAETSPAGDGPNATSTDGKSRTAGGRSKETKRSRRRKESTGRTADSDVRSGRTISDVSDTRREDREELNPDLGAEEVDRAFQILEEAVTSDALGNQQLDQLLTVLEQSLARPEDTESETVVELLAMLEDLILEPNDLGAVDLDGFLSIFEEAIKGTTPGDDDEITAMFDVIEEGINDPTSIDPNDVEQFRAGIESAVMDMTDPSSGSFGGLFSLPNLLGQQAVGEDLQEAEEVDMFRIARVAAGMTQRASGYSVESGIRTGTRMAYAAANSKSPAELLTSARAVALDELQRAGIDIGEDQESWLEAHEDKMVDTRPLTLDSLKDRGDELIDQSAEIGRDESIHPAFPVILDQLATDEARILRLLANEGPQGVVDIIERQFLTFRSSVYAENLNMLGTDAGCRMPKRAPLYLDNLCRLGLVTVVDEPIENLKRYQILEAQPHIELARDRAKRPKTKFKSVRLTDFGVTFCQMCFSFEVDVRKQAAWLRDQAETEPPSMDESSDTD